MRRRRREGEGGEGKRKKKLRAMTDASKAKRPINDLYRHGLGKLKGLAHGKRERRCLGWAKGRRMRRCVNLQFWFVGSRGIL